MNLNRLAAGTRGGARGAAGDPVERVGHLILHFFFFVVRFFLFKKENFVNEAVGYLNHASESLSVLARRAYSHAPCVGDGHE